MTLQRLERLIQSQPFVCKWNDDARTIDYRLSIELDNGAYEVRLEQDYGWRQVISECRHFVLGDIVEMLKENEGVWSHLGIDGDRFGDADAVDISIWEFEENE